MNLTKEQKNVVLQIADEVFTGNYEDVVSAFEALESLDDFARMDIPVEPIGQYKVLRKFIETCDDLVAENERLKAELDAEHQYQACMDNNHSHDVGQLKEQLTATRTALAAAEADNERLQNKFNVSAEFTGILSDLDLVFENKELRNQLAAAEAREAKFIAALDQAESALGEIRDFPLTYLEVSEALAQPRDDSALREMIAEVYKECANIVDAMFCDNGVSARHTLADASAELRLRALAEKAKVHK